MSGPLLSSFLLLCWWAIPAGVQASFFDPTTTACSAGGPFQLLSRPLFLIPPSLQVQGCLCIPWPSCLLCWWAIPAGVQASFVIPPVHSAGGPFQLVTGPLLSIPPPLQVQGCLFVVLVLCFGSSFVAPHGDCHSQN